MTVNGGDVDLNAATGHVFLNDSATTTAGPFIRGNSLNTYILAQAARIRETRLAGRRVIVCRGGRTG